MAVTLEQARLNVQDALQMGIIDEFRKSNYLLENMTFDDVVSPTGGGSSLTYAYTRLLTQPSAAFRAINTEYGTGEATKKRFTVDLKTFGGAFTIDRVISDMGGIIDETAFQMQQQVKATSALFNETVINGDSAVDSESFDGLEKALTGSSTELTPTAAIDLSSSVAIDKNFAHFLDILDEFISGLDGTPSALLCNRKMAAKLRAVARRATMYSVTKDNFGAQVEHYGNIPFIDVGDKQGSAAPVIGINAGTGETSLYAVRLGLDGLHAISMAGRAPMKFFPPDFSTAGAVKRGEVEMVAAIALKASKAAGVLRKIKIQ